MSQFLTASYTIRKPTAKKTEILDVAVGLYTQAAQRLLDWCLANLDTIREDGQLTKTVANVYTTVLIDGEWVAVPVIEKTGKYNADSIKRIFPALSTLRLPLSSAVNEALISDISSAVASYLELVKKDPRTQFPTAIREEIEDEGDRLSVLSEIAELGDNLERENELFYMLSRRRKTVGRPICFSRARDFAILCKPDEPHELYAWLPLLPGENTMIERYVFDGSMVDLATGEPFKKRSNMGVIVKLYIPTDSASNWYNKRFLQPIFDGVAKIKSAKLVKRVDHWKLNVSVQFETPEEYKPQKYIGVSVGSLEKIGYAITDLEGRILSEHMEDLGIVSLNASNRRHIAKRQREGKFVDAAHYRGQSQVEMLHKIADTMIAIAKRERAMLVVEDFSVKQGANVHIKKGGRLSKLMSPWRKFEFILSYKSNLAGVPVRLGMWSAQSKSICVNCGGECEADKETHYQIMQCKSCMLRKHKQLIASSNLARRMTYVKKQWDGKGGYLAFHRSLALRFSQLQPVS